MALCADSKAYYETYRPYSLIDGELTTTTADCSSECDDDFTTQSSGVANMFGDEVKPADS